MRKLVVSISLLFVLILAACQTPSSDQIKITTTLFPYYDIIRSLATDEMDVSLILPPGTDPHDFDPSPSQLVRILESNLFIFNSESLESWVSRIEPDLAQRSVQVLEMASYIGLVESEDDHDEHDDHDDHDEHDEHDDHDDHDEHDDHDDHDHGIYDPHIWTDPINLIILVSTIRDAMIELAPESADEITANAQAYIDELQAIHVAYSNWMTTRSSEVMMHGGHNAFAYLAARYDITFVNAYAGFSTDAEPTPGALQDMIQTMNETQSTHLFSEKLIAQNVATTLASETGAVILYLYSKAILTSEELEEGLTLFDMFNHNLAQLKIGMGPRE